MKILSYFLFVLISILIIACSSSNENFTKDHKEQYATNALTTNLKLTEVSNFFAKKYLKNLVSKINYNANKYLSLQNSPPNIYLINNSNCFAFTTKNSEIYLSTRLFKNLKTDAELAFIVAHEYAHILLGLTNSNFASLNQKHKLEINADKYALYLSAYLGYNPLSSLSALVNSAACYNSLPNEQLSLEAKNHPSIEDRLNNLKLEIENSSLDINHEDFEGREFYRIKQEIL